YWTLLTLLQALALGLVWFKTRHPDVRGAWWLVLFNAGIGIVSYLGSLGPLSSPLIPYPLDYVAMAVFSVVVYIVGVYTAYETSDLKDVKQKGLPIE
ncbi:MAG: APC family permease, partial [Acidilobus sp.]